MGTGPFAVPMFRGLLAGRHRVLALVTRLARSSRAGVKPPPSPMRAVAEGHGLPVLDPESINTPVAREALAALAPDLFVVADYGQILSPETLAVARLGGINLHGSILPKYRGAAPINWALYHGDTETGVTVIHMTPRVDAGPIVAIARTPIDPEEDAVALEQRLAQLGAPLVSQVVDQLAAGQVESLPQDASQACGARRLRKTDGEIDWSRSAPEIKNQVRALEPWPRTSTHWLRQHATPLRVILGHVTVEARTSDSPPGTVVAASSGRLVIATGTGLLAIDQLQPAGKRMMSAGEFLNGHPVATGERFGSP
ncbi:MAG TPA: methionyl-tRNA formyltransferase [Pirellulales bacterium]|jgi:methionyl-tRNA formyltransferase|nr:methionyl-tRNA formyltransferase [Pirellulales bacterium]